MILAEIGDFSFFDSPDKILPMQACHRPPINQGIFHWLEPTLMEKRGSRYLRYALYNATKYVCHWDPGFAAYLAKKASWKGKHYNVALSHAS